MEFSKLWNPANYEIQQISKSSKFRNPANILNSANLEIQQISKFSKLMKFSKFEYIKVYTLWNSSTMQHNWWCQLVRRIHQVNNSRQTARINKSLKHTCTKASRDLKYTTTHNEPQQLKHDPLVKYWQERPYAAGKQTLMAEKHKSSKFVFCRNLLKFYFREIHTKYVRNSYEIHTKYEIMGSDIFQTNLNIFEETSCEGVSHSLNAAQCQLQYNWKVL